MLVLTNKYRWSKLYRPRLEPKISSRATLFNCERSSKKWSYYRSRCSIQEGHTTHRAVELIQYKAYAKKQRVELRQKFLRGGLVSPIRQAKYEFSITMINLNYYIV